MRVEVEDVNPVKKRLYVEVPIEEVAREIQGAFRKLSKEAHIKGFRKGKIPKKILEQYYGEKIESDVTNKLITSTFVKALESKKVDPVSKPEIDAGDLKEGNIFKYSATFEVAPEVKVQGYEDLVIEKGKVTVTEKDVDDSIETLRERHAQWQEVGKGEVVKKGHLITIDFEGFMDDSPIKDGNAKDFPFEVGSGRLLPDIEEQVIGMKVGETKEVNVTFPDDYNNERLAGKEAVFTVTLKGIKEKKLPEIDDDFAKDLQSKDLKELKKTVKEKLIKQGEIDGDKKWRVAVLDKLFELNPFELPPSLVEEHFKGLIDDTVKNLKKQGFSNDNITVYLKSLQNQYRERAESEVRNGIILKALAEREAIDVSQEDIDLKLSEMASLFGETVENLKRHERDKQFLNNIKQQIVEDKIFQLIGKKQEEKKRNAFNTDGNRADGKG